jgi:sulfite dehydrogenase
MSVSRRAFLKRCTAIAASAALPACEGIGPAPQRGNAARVVVIGGGFGGGSAAKYVKLWAPDVDVVLIERSPQFISCPLSNLVFSGNTTLQSLTFGYDGLRHRGVRVVHDEASAVDAGKREVRLSSGGTVPYDRLIVSPGADIIYDAIPGLRSAAAQERIPHTWRAGDETVLLTRQLRAMRDGGVYALHIPVAPYRCPPGPYERVCQIAEYFKRAKPRSKILVFDANPDITSKKALFLGAWEGIYKGMIEYRPNSEIEDIDAPGMILKLQFEDVKADVINIVPPQRAGEIARATGLITANQRWCGVDWLTAESVAVKGIHVLGDATLAASAMPKSATMANQHGKLCAAAVIALLKGEAVDPQPVIVNACYSFVTGKTAGHISSVHTYDAREKAMLPVKGAGGISAGPTEAEGEYAWGWARNIWADSLA